MRTKNIFTVCLLLLGVVLNSNSQDLLEILDNEQKSEIGYVPATFKMTRIAFGHSTETRSKGVLEVFAANRFWNTPEPRSQSFAADKLSTRIALEYGISDRLSMGIGGTTFDGLFDGYLKYSLFNQQGGDDPFPFNITLFQGGSYNSSGIPNPAINDDFNDRLSFTSQILISRRVSSNFSVQVAPTYVHKSLGLTTEDPNNFFAMGFGARYKLGLHVAVVSEYYATFNPIESFNTYGPFALGVNWELSDVQLQFMLTNAVNMVEDTFITQTRNNFNFKNPNLNFGFNATYVIHFNNALRNTKKRTDSK
ncbi:DUF5777 family beta-barrel protein [Aureisphaera galaxeae]|uniref:DUF5777 family beta-barrel protein n=1 Tax=Aureisphaera galaxeae TaxID=1538023 RepID=UPI00234FDC75|nr:DUF5777 family beta-barrel protein [Aureisphaera galaxeae]MDC8005881.1 DUF5777 family beta-barrel protein [Aureisphaera galaxeae]